VLHYFGMIMSHSVCFTMLNNTCYECFVEPAAEHETRPLVLNRPVKRTVIHLHLFTVVM